MEHRHDGSITKDDLEDASNDELDWDGNNRHGAKSIYHVARSEVDTLGSTRSLYDGDFDYIELNGRKFIGDYYSPIDEMETSRWSMLHKIYFDVLGKSNTTVPLQNPRRILDVGCGRGDWAADIGDEYPNAEVVGSDIAPLQDRAAIMPNVDWEIDDAEMEGGWTYTNPFDFIHFRGMKGAFKDWSYIYSQTYMNLVPGGWVEVLDYENYDNILSRFVEEPDVTEWFSALFQAISKSPRPFNSDHLSPELLEQAGFEDITTEFFEIPIGAWGETEDDRTNGKVFLDLQMAAVEPLCLRYLHDYGGWSLDEINALCEKAIKLMRTLRTNAKLAEGCTFRIKVLKGRKPLRRPSNAINSSLSNLESESDDTQSVSTVTKDNFNGA